jgi:hypothetical protein
MPTTRNEAILSQNSSLLEFQQISGRNLLQPIFSSLNPNNICSRMGWFIQFSAPDFLNLLMRVSRQFDHLNVFKRYDSDRAVGTGNEINVDTKCPSPPRIACHSAVPHGIPARTRNEPKIKGRMARSCFEPKIKSRMPRVCFDVPLNLIDLGVSRLPD